VNLSRTFTAMAEAERRYRSVFEGAGEGLFQVTHEGKLTIANRLTSGWPIGVISLSSKCTQSFPRRRRQKESHHDSN